MELCYCKIKNHFNKNNFGIYIECFYINDFIGLFKMLVYSTYF